MKKFLDLSDVRCPLAFVQCKHALLNLAENERLEVLLTDPDSVADILSWADSQPVRYQTTSNHHEIKLEFRSDPSH